MTVVRWTFLDIVTDERVVLPINPNEANGTDVPREMSWAWGSYWGQDRMRGMNRPPQSPVEWTFSGVLQTQEHHDLLLEWFRRSSILHVTDHLHRTYEIMASKFEFVDRTPTPRHPWRGTYTMTCLMLKEVTT